MADGTYLLPSGKRIREGIGSLRTTKERRPTVRTINGETFLPEQGFETRRYAEEYATAIRRYEDLHARVIRTKDRWWVYTGNLIHPRL